MYTTHHTTSFIQRISRFAFILGIVLAVSSTAVIVHAAPNLLSTTPAEVVRLDPVTVTISAAHFDEIRAEAQSSTLLAKR